MADEARPAERLADAYRIWRDSKGTQFQQWLDLVSDRIEMRSVLNPELPDDFAAHRSSIEEVKDYFRILSRDWEMIGLEIERIIDAGDDVVCVSHHEWRNRATGRIASTPKVDVWHFEEGRATSFLEAFDSFSYIKASPAGNALAAA